MSITTDQLKKGSLFTYRLFIVLSILLLAVAVGGVIAYHLAQTLKAGKTFSLGNIPISTGTSGASIVLLAATFKQYKNALVNGYRFITKNETFDGYKEWYSLTISAFLLCFAISMQQNTENINQQEDKKNEFDWNVVYLSQTKEKTPYLAQFPLFFEKGGLNSKGVLVSGFQLNIPKPNPKINAQDNKVASLIKGLLSCVDSTSKQAVRISIQGHASSKEFLDGNQKPVHNSNQLNADLAYLRAQAVYTQVLAVLNETGTTQGFIVEPLDKSAYTIEQVKNNAFIVDRNGKQLSEGDQDFLNQSAFIQVIELGQCQKLSKQL